MVGVKEYPEELKAVVFSDKRVGKYLIERDTSGYGFFIFKSDQGKIPEELSGKYTSIRNAVRAFTSFDAGTKQSRAVRQAELQEYREQRRAKPTAKSK